MKEKKLPFIRFKKVSNTLAVWFLLSATYTP
jgi:hypothetical protein